MQKKSARIPNKPTHFIWGFWVVTEGFFRFLEYLFWWGKAGKKIAPDAMVTRVARGGSGEGGGGALSPPRATLSFEVPSLGRPFPLCFGAPGFETPDCPPVCRAPASAWKTPQNPGKTIISKNLADHRTVR